MTIEELEDEQSRVREVMDEAYKTYEMNFDLYRYASDAGNYDTADEAERTFESAWRVYDTAKNRLEWIERLLSILSKDTEIMTIEELRDALPHTRATMEKAEAAYRAASERHKAIMDRLAAFGV